MLGPWVLVLVKTADSRPSHPTQLKLVDCCLLSQTSHVFRGSGMWNVSSPPAPITALTAQNVH